MTLRLRYTGLVIFKFPQTIVHTTGLTNSEMPTDSYFKYPSYFIVLIVAETCYAIFNWQIRKFDIIAGC